MAKNYHYIEWNHREEQMLLDMRKNGYSFYRIANEFGMTVESVKQKYRKIKQKKHLFNYIMNLIIVYDIYHKI